jgi:dihydroneopterin aldolase
VSGAIEVRGLRALGTHGVLAEEVGRPQPFEVDLDIVASLDDATETDALDQAIDYGPIVEAVRKLVESSHFALLEALAGAIGDVVLLDPRIDAVTVALRKLRPPVAADISTVGVRLTRRRADGPRSHD